MRRRFYQVKKMHDHDRYDIVVIGGGITGAGIFFQAVCSGFKTLLLEAQDFSFGTTSRTGKLVHGGFRYLQHGELGVSYHSVREREMLIHKGKNLVKRMPFIYLANENKMTENVRNVVAMNLYHLFAGKIGFDSIKTTEVNKVVGIQNIEKNQRGMGFSEGSTDDSRLTLRLIFDGIKLGGEARNYSTVKDFLKSSEGKYYGVVVSENKGDKNNIDYEIHASVVINATGIWMDDVCKGLGLKKRIRKQRGSHLIFPYEKLPIKCGVMFNHPVDDRIQFALPWFGRIVFGTTDLDEQEQSYEVTDEPGISEKELDYLLVSVNKKFPRCNLEPSGIISTYCGIRPIIRNNSARPYTSSRRHKIWDDNGLISIAGGKLTTFQYMAYQTLQKAEKYLGKKIHPEIEHVFLNKEITEDQERYANISKYVNVKQKYGLNSNAFFDQLESHTALDTCIQDSPFTLADIRWAARNEMVEHLDDLLFRRTRLGLLFYGGGINEIQKFKNELKQDLSWNEKKWNKVIIIFERIWKNKYSLPG